MDCTDGSVDGDVGKYGFEGIYYNIKKNPRFLAKYLAQNVKRNSDITGSSSLILWQQEVEIVSQLLKKHYPIDQWLNDQTYNKIVRTTTAPASQFLKSLISSPPTFATEVESISERVFTIHMNQDMNELNGDKKQENLSVNLIVLPSIVQTSNSNSNSNRNNNKNINNNRKRYKNSSNWHTKNKMKFMNVNFDENITGKIDNNCQCSVESLCLDERKEQVSSWMSIRGKYILNNTCLKRIEFNICSIPYEQIVADEPCTRFPNEYGNDILHTLVDIIAPKSKYTNDDVNDYHNGKINEILNDDSTNCSKLELEDAVGITLQKGIANANNSPNNGMKENEENENEKETKNSNNSNLYDNNSSSISNNNNKNDNINNQQSLIINHETQLSISKELRLIPRLSESGSVIPSSLNVDNINDNLNLYCTHLRGPSLNAILVSEDGVSFVSSVIVTSLNDGSDVWICPKYELTAVEDSLHWDVENDENKDFRQAGQLIVQQQTRATIF